MQPGNRGSVPPPREAPLAARGGPAAPRNSAGAPPPRSAYDRSYAGSAQGGSPYPALPPNYPPRPRPGRPVGSSAAARPAPQPGAAPVGSPGRAAQSRSGLTVTGVGAVLLLVVAGALGAAIDLVFGPALGTATTVLLPIGALVASWVVRRSALFWVIIAPPLVYLLLVAGSLAVGDGELTPAAMAAGIVYGFPAMAVATAVSVAVGALRQVNHR